MQARYEIYSIYEKIENKFSDTTRMWIWRLTQVTVQEDSWLKSNTGGSSRYHMTKLNTVVQEETHD